MSRFGQFAQLGKVNIEMPHHADTVLHDMRHASDIMATQWKAPRMPKKVLVVDDDMAMVRVLETHLAQAGYEVTTACDGIEAMEQIGKARPDFMLLDIAMPRMNGYQVLRKLQSDPRYKDIAVIILTAKAEAADMDRGWQAGVAAYITKPINVDNFVTMLKRMEQFMDDGMGPAESIPGND
jgi:CheY-like chemotaxis protein